MTSGKSTTGKRALKKQPREKQEAREVPATEQPAPGVRKNLPLLIVSAAALAVWMGLLFTLAVLIQFGVISN